MSPPQGPVEALALALRLAGLVVAVADSPGSSSAVLSVRDDEHAPAPLVRAWVRTGAYQDVRWGTAWESRADLGEGVDCIAGLIVSAALRERRARGES